MTTPRALLIALTTLSFVQPLAAENCETPIQAGVVRELRRMVGSGDLQGVVVASRTAGEVRAGLVEWALHLRSTPIAEEMLQDFGRRNAAPAALDGHVPFPTIDLARYRNGDAIDWARVTRDYREAATIIELSRPGCDAHDTLGVVQVRLHNRTGNDVDGWMLHMSKQPDATWSLDLARVGFARTLFGGACESGSAHPDYAAVCARYVK